jgi:hypothetical protein
MLLRMNAQEAERWARKRTRGRLRFILFYGVLLFGGSFLPLWAAVLWFTVSRGYFERVFFSHPVSLIAVVTLAGAVWGFLMWETFEFRFRRHTQ